MKCKITVLKRTLNSELAGKYVKTPVSPCELFQEGQEFVSQDFRQPEGFGCVWAWNDIFKTVVTLLRGGNFSHDMFEGWMNDDHTMITCCTDGIRPVVFKVEEIKE